jgi:hypothetical protein
MRLETAFVILIIDHDTDNKPVTSCQGPYSKEEAVGLSNQFNEEYDGSPYHSIVRQITKIVMEGVDSNG